MNTQLMKFVFAASAVYDVILAVVFLLFGPSVFSYFGIEPPNHMGYMHFPALLLIVFGAMYWQISSDPLRFRNLIPYGIGLKVSYCTVVFYHWATGTIPAMWIPMAWIDLVFLILFIQAWRKIGSLSRATA